MLTDKEERIVKEFNTKYSNFKEAAEKNPLLKKNAALVYNKLSNELCGLYGQLIHCENIIAFKSFLSRARKEYKDTHKSIGKALQKKQSEKPTREISEGDGEIFTENQVRSLKLNLHGAYK